MENVTLTLSTTAAEAAKAGVDQYGETTVTVRPSALSPSGQDMLVNLLAVRGSLSTGSVVYRAGLQFGVLPVPAVPTTESVEQWVEACAVALAQKINAREQEEIAGEKHLIAKTQAWCARPLEEIIQRADRWAPISPYSFAAAMETEVNARLAEAQKVCDAHNAEVTARNEKITAARAAAAERRSEQLTQWLETKASEGMRKRAARGLLPEEDLIAAIRNETFAPLAELKRFERLTDEDVRRGLDADDDQDVDYVTRGAESAHDEDIGLMERIEALLPGATCTLTEHAGWLAEANGRDDPEVTRYAVKVAIKVGELEFTREYAANQGEE